MQTIALTDPYSKAKGKTITREQVYAAKVHGWKILSLALAGVVGLEFFQIRDLQTRSQVYVKYVFLDPKTAEITKTQTIDDTEGDVPAGLLIAGNLRKWVKEAFSVSSDIQEQSDRRDRVYRRVSGTAADVLDAYYKDSNPFELGKAKVITVRVTECQQQSETTWKLKWELHSRDLSGRSLGFVTRCADLQLKPAARHDIDSQLEEPKLFTVADFIWGHCEIESR